MFFDGLQESRRHGRVVFRALEERLDVALDHGERRAQLVADVGDEFLARVFQLFEPRQVVEHENHSLWFPVPLAQRGGVDLQTAVIEAGQFQFEAEHLTFRAHPAGQLL